MAKVKVLLPQWGMGMSEGTLTSWLKGVGDRVEEGDGIAVVEAEKVEDEVPAPSSGTIVELLIDINSTVPVRTAIAIIEG